MKIQHKHNTPMQQYTTITEKSLVLPRETPGKYLEIQGTGIEYRTHNESYDRNRTSSGRNRERSICEGANTMEQ
jgi:hypothetical protein